jgi:DNA-binding transcriptional ArsR family regulator
MSDQIIRDYELDDELDVDTPARLRALGNPLRSAIVDLVLERAMSVTEIAERVDRPRGTVAHHVGVLVESGLVQVVRTRRVRAIEERFYGRTALTYVLPARAGELPYLDAVRNDVDHERLHAPDGSGVGGATYRRARLPTARAEEFDRRLLELAIEFSDGPRGGDTEYGMYLALFPTVRRMSPPPGEVDGEAGSDE